MRIPLLAATLLVPTTALAGGNYIPTENPRDLALSQAAVADQHGAEAVFANTAALAGQEGFNVSAAGQLLLNQTEWTVPGDSASLSGANVPPTVTFAYGARLDNGMAWGAGIGLTVPAGGVLEWPDGWTGQERIQSVKQQVFQIGAGVGFQPLPYLKVGASLLRYQQTEELHQSVFYLDHYGDAGIAMAGGATTFGLAGEFTAPTIPLTLAVTYKHSADMKLTGDAHFTGVPPGFQPMLHDQGVTREHTFPFELYVGAAYEVVPDLKIMGAWSFENWSTLDADTFVGDDGFSVSVPRDYNNAYVFRLGGEWQKASFLPALALRLGALRSMSPQPTETVSPSLTDGNSTAVSLGAGYSVTRDLRVDFGAQFVFFDEVTATGDEAFPGTYKTTVQLFSLGANYRFGR